MIPRDRWGSILAEGATLGVLLIAMLAAIIL